MIAVRGPNAIMVLDRTSVPVKEICDALIEARTITDVTARYGITNEEVMECVDAFCDNRSPTPNDFLLLETDFDNHTMDIEAVGLSDWVFFTLLRLGEMYEQQSDELGVLFARGLEEVIHDCLIDVANGKKEYQSSHIHVLVFEALEQTHGTINQPEAETLLIELTRDNK